MLNRRGFLGVGAAALAAAFDPERALWRPGAKFISVPRVVHVPEWVHFGMECVPNTLYSEHCALEVLFRDVAGALAKHGRSLENARFEKMPAAPSHLHCLHYPHPAIRAVTYYSGHFGCYVLSLDCRVLV